MTEDFSKEERIRNAPLIYRGFTGWPTYAPDGKHIIFTDNADILKCHLVKIDVNQPNNAITITDPKIGAKRPAYHPDSQTVAFNLNNESIWIMDLQNQMYRPYLPEWIRGEQKWIHPCFAPDGQSIVVASYQRGGPQREEVLYRLSPDSENTVTQITQYPEVCAGRLAISPGGSQIVFAGHAGAFNQLENRLWKVGADGKSVVLEEGSKAEKHGRCPAYSPDGCWVACVSARPMHSPKEETPMSVWIIRSDGSSAFRLTDASLKPTHMAWSPDQRRLAVTGAFGLQLIPLPDIFYYRGKAKVGTDSYE